MVNASGIGTYIKNTLPKVITRIENSKFYLLGRKEELEELNFNRFSNVKLIDFNAPIYSIKEQIIFPFKIPKNITLFWSPHYNFPVLYRGKLLVSVMDVGHIALKQINFELRKKFYSFFMFNQIAQRAKSIMYISDFTKSEFNKYVGKPKNSEFVTLLGVDKEWFNIKTRKALHSFPYLLYVGNVKPHKNLKILIEAYEKICNKIQLKLVIVGKKEGFITSDKSLFDKSDKIGNEIIFTGEVTDSQLKQYFKQAKLFVFPSLYEGFGLPPP